MYTPEDIRNVTFQRSVSGYKPGDVEAFLEELAQQIEDMNANRSFVAPQPAPAKQTGISGISEEGLQNLLISAQRTADSIIAEAREKAAQIVAEAEQKAQTNNSKLRMQLEQTQEKIKAVIEESDKKSNDLIKTATSKSDSMISAAHDSVARQQLLFDKLKVTVSDFKKDLVSLYKKQLELISDIPDEVPASPDDIARAVEFVIDSHPSPESFINGAEEATAPADTADLSTAANTAETAPEYVAEEPAVNPAAEIEVTPTQPIDETSGSFNLFEAPAESDAPEQAQPSPIMSPSPEKQERRRSSLRFFEEYDEDDDDEDYDDEPKGLFKRRKK